MKKMHCAAGLAMALVLLMLLSLLCTMSLHYVKAAAGGGAEEEAREINCISRTASMSVPAEPEKAAAYRSAVAIHGDQTERTQRMELFSAVSCCPALFVPHGSGRLASVFLRIAGLEGFPDYGIVMKC